MKMALYGKRDYRFGQLMLTLRNRIGLTQAGLATHLNISRRAVGEWETGNSYPKAEHLKELIVLGVMQQAFPPGHEAEEIRVLWKAARQKMLLDEHWLSTLLDQQSSLQRQRNMQLHVEPQSVDESSPGRLEPLQGVVGTGETSGYLVTSNPPMATQVDWGDALAVPLFYGREQELAELSEWLVRERCRMVGVLGIGGIGKSALSVSIMHQEAGHFDVVLFRSVRDAPSCEELLDDCLQVLSPQEYRPVPAGQVQDTVPTEQRITFLLSHLRKVRVLLVLDNLEYLLETGNPRGQFRSGFEGYGQLLRRVAETVHQSCLLFTSREQPMILREYTGKNSPVHFMRLAGLDIAACKQLLEEKGIASELTSGIGTASELERLIEIYGGNPLALKIVAETIVDLFGGELSPFLVGDTIIFGGITDLLDEQIARLGALERTVLRWLAIVREPVTLDELLRVLVPPKTPSQLLEAVDSLYRHSLIERGKRPGSFTLQSVVLEYMTAVLVASGSHEIRQFHLDKLIEHGLSQATAREYVRQTQERLLLSPLLAELQGTYLRQIGGPSLDPIPEVSAYKPVEDTLLGLLDSLRKQNDFAQGYGPANLIALLRLLRGHLNALDLSHLCIREVYLQDIEMQDAKLSGSLMQDCVWTSAVDVAWAVAMSGNGKWWASGGIQGQVRVWEGVHPYMLHLVWQAHTDFVYTLAFSPDGRLLASGSQDGSIKLWEVERGALLWTARQAFPVNLAFSPDGRLLASGELHTTVRLWDVQSGRHLQTLTPPSDAWAVAWSPDGSLLAGGCVGGEIRLWERQKGKDLAFTPRLSMQTNWVTTLAFSPDGRTLVSVSWGDQTVKLWEVATGQLLRTLTGYTGQSRGVAWSPDGRILAYSNPENGIWLWDTQEGRIRAVLHGHSTDICGMAFTPDGTRLFSGSADGTLRVWDVSDSRCVRVIQGYGIYLYDLAWSPDSTHLMSGDTNGQVTVWDVSSARPSSVLHYHTWIVEGVGWSPDKQYCASCGLDGILCLWNPISHALVQKFENARLLLLSMAWSPHGSQLACGTYGQGIQVWDAITRSLSFFGQTGSVAFWCVDWSPDGTQLVGGGDDGCLYLWKCTDRSKQAQGTGQAQGTVPMRLSGHHSRITSVAWSPDGEWLASGSGTSSNGELFVWDAERAVHVKTLEGHPSMVYALTWSRRRDGDQLISAGADGKLYWWNVETAECTKTQNAHQGTIRSLKVSPDGKFLASCGDDGAVKIWDLTRNAHLLTLRPDRPYERLNITGIRGLNAAQIASLRALGAIENA